MQTDKIAEDVEGNPDRVDPYYQQGKVACAMFTVLLLFSFLVIGIVTGLNFKKSSQEDQNRGLLSDDITPIPFQYKSDKGLCSDGWLLYKNTCYLLENVYGTWESSKSLCLSLGAHLMVVDSEEELEFISRVVQNWTDYWIGLKRDKMGKWSWVNGDDYHSNLQLEGLLAITLIFCSLHRFSMGCSFWDENQPAHGGMESCVYLKGSDTVYRKLFHDADCSSQLFHICEHQL